MIPPRPPLLLALGPAGSGKTAWAIERFQSHPGRSLLVVSSSEQAATCARRIADATGISETEIQPSVISFHGLIADMLRPLPDDGFRVISRTFQRLILDELFRTHIRPSDFLGRMLTAPGFVPALAERLRDWKLACVTSETLEESAFAATLELDDPVFCTKTQEFVRLFRAYELFLRQNRLRDDEDCLHLVAERAADSALPLPLDIELLIADGFFRFNRAQRNLIAALAGRGLEQGAPELSVGITLPFEAGRPLLFAAPQRTLDTLRAEFDTREETLPPRTSERPERLSRLERHLFSPRGAPTQETPCARPLVTLFDAPNPYVEAEMVAREFRRIHTEGGVVWDDFAVILRGMGDYAPILAAVFERYEIPLGTDGAERLRENPLVKTVLQLLAVVRRGWQRDDVLAFLKSSYTAPDRLAVDGLRHRARIAGVRQGRDKWFDLAVTTGGVIEETLCEMARFEALFTLDAEPPEHAARVKEVVAQFGMETRIKDGEPTRIRRDEAAWREACEGMSALGQMSAFGENSLLSFAQFHDALLGLWNAASATASAEGDRVRVAEPYDARQRPVKVAAIMGLTERVFPRRVSEDPFLRDDERAALRRTGGIDLEPQKNRSDDERFLFYLAVTAPSDQLLLSYPRSSNESDTLPSFFLDEVRAVFLPAGGSLPHIVSRTLADVAPRFGEAVCPADSLRTACAELFDPSVDDIRGAAFLLQECLTAAGKREADVTEPSPPSIFVPSAEAKPSINVEEIQAVLSSRRLPPLPRLTDPTLRADFAGSERIFSILELEAYRRCPLQYLLQHHMQLRAEEDGANARVQENLLRHVLRRHHRRPPAADADARRQHLNQLLTETLERANLDSGPHRLRLTQRLLGDALDAYLQREYLYAPLFGMSPAHAHLTFGSTAKGEDAASSPEPLTLIAPDGSVLRVSGVLDRVDLDATGQRALLLTYRLTTAPEFADIQRGVSLQLPLGLLALERLFGYHAAAACYDASPQPGRPRLFRTEHVSLRQFAPVLPQDTGRTVTPLNRQQFAEIIAAAETAAHLAAHDIRKARVDATPGEHCARCACTDVCRTTKLGFHDGESPPPLPDRSALQNQAVQRQ